MPFRYQALVPIWDAVNHVTGRCNTRLHHCAKTGALQMIAEAAVPSGHQVSARNGCSQASCFATQTLTLLTTSMLCA